MNLENYAPQKPFSQKHLLRLQDYTKDEILQVLSLALDLKAKQKARIPHKLLEGMNIVLRAVCMLLILLVGHAINIGLCTISSLVHPLRLIFVEYYKNAEFEGGGKEYRPFKKA